MPATRDPCFVCKTVEGKYRCPRCDCYTCSVACSREHRDNHPVIEEEPKSPANNNLALAVQAVSLDQQHPIALADIADTLEYKTLLQRYPDLEKQLWEIAAATDPPKPTQSGMMSRKANQPWTQEIGMTQAVQLVQSIKTSPGDVRDALREFSDLVSIFKKRMQEDDQARKERAKHDAQIISSLLREEKS
ncbi:hypothetical protein HD806DRAFT_531210 [Xylariaceae sp. AK1471]|nr:hypothetical protein HD806DRAFT_531210 [Xylariaceae sp. AK1471]